MAKTVGMGAKQPETAENKEITKLKCRTEKGAYGSEEGAGGTGKAVKGENA